MITEKYLAGIIEKELIDVIKMNESINFLNKHYRHSKKPIKAAEHISSFLFENFNLIKRKRV